MNFVNTDLSNSRKLGFVALDELQTALPWSPLALLLPAFHEQERDRAYAAVQLLPPLAVVEICCLGPEAELLHDKIDAHLEDQMLINVVTTWHTDWEDGKFYFLSLAGGGDELTLIAAVADHPDLVSLLIS